MSGTQHSESPVATGSLSFQTDSGWRLDPGREEYKRFVRLMHSLMQLTDSPPHSKPCSGIPPRLTCYPGNLSPVIDENVSPMLTQLDSRHARPRTTHTHVKPTPRAGSLFAQYALQQRFDKRSSNIGFADLKKLKQPAVRRIQKPTLFQAISLSRQTCFYTFILNFLPSSAVPMATRDAPNQRL